MLGIPGTTAKAELQVYVIINKSALVIPIIEATPDHCVTLCAAVCLLCCNKLSTHKVLAFQGLGVQ